jgi:hypothetical protein
VSKKDRLEKALVTQRPWREVVAGNMVWFWSKTKPGVLAGFALYRVPMGAISGFRAISARFARFLGRNEEKPLKNNIRSAHGTPITKAGVAASR